MKYRALMEKYMKKTILFFWVLSLIITHGSYAFPDGQQNNNISKGEFEIGPRAPLNIDPGNVNPDLEANRKMLLLPRELPVRTKLMAGIGIGIPLVMVAAYVGLH